MGLPINAVTTPTGRTVGRLMKKDIEEKKVALEKQKLQSQKELQKMKDDAALEREKLKAKTALKNKVVGEK